MNSTVIQSIGWLALLPKNVTKPSFESSWALTTSYRLQSVFKRLQPSSRCCDVDHRFDLCRPIPYAGRWRRWDVEQSPFTVLHIDLCWRRPPLLSKAPQISS